MDLAGFGDLLRGALKDLEGGAGEIVKPIEKAGQDISGAFSGIARDIEGGAGEVAKPVENAVSDVSGALSGLKEDIGNVGRTVRKDFSSFGDFLRRNKLAIGIGAGVGLAGGLGAYEYLKSRNQPSGYNSQLSGGYNGQLGGGYNTESGAGGYSGTAGETGLESGTGYTEAGGYPGTAGTAGLPGGQGSGIFGSPLIWIIIAVLIIMIIIVVVMYKKKG